jgi:hypothetical protein
VRGYRRLSTRHLLFRRLPPEPAVQARGDVHPGHASPPARAITTSSAA